MRKLASVRKIDKLSPIEGADKIELAHTGGWQCVVAKGDFQPNQLAVFFEVDSALPNEERYEFLRDRCLRIFTHNGEPCKEVLRIKTVKFKGQLSQGLFMPLSKYPELGNEYIEEGTDLTELLHIEHYDELKDTWDMINGGSRVNPQKKADFPRNLVARSDEERLQNLTKYFETMKDVEFEITEKFDGSSTTFIYAPDYRPDDPFFICSRNLELKTDADCDWVRMAASLNIKEKMEALPKANIAIQGELVGPGLNANRDMYTEPHFKVFRVWDIDKKEWLIPEARYALCETLGLEHVKVIKERDKSFQYMTTMEDFLEFVKGKTDHGREREGMVWKSMDGTISFKVINNEYLLKQKD